MTLLYITTSRPLYGGGSGVCVYFVYVYIVLWFVGFLLVSLELVLLSLDQLWASFWEPLGRLWLPRGRPWRHCGLPLAPSARRGTIWGTLGSQGELGMTLRPKWTSNSEQMALK